ncbi:hypothetical protein COT82_00730 [Candidatus Campbellbacteria bacterium CG10_big_fil_rev_8_21_14_0_10_35_52]|uniref:Uncharacterized protein n=1 Tax=Candidatus Campbellbacteria bacterium CG10_big_fil_rev_8_21_14_0_10_35_52 TaxID=1974527 RepID=A0A2M6WVS6_9BACT|nr:MAG: hypothetical protein COT82_00730 [Candidatus Campbellbacteria bacterium CG10_big_fil_rev_8_21_14_0_10_35_52]
MTMTNNIFPELDGWDEIIHPHLTDKNLVSLIKATRKLVLSLANLRSATSSQLGYLQDKIECLQNNVSQVNESFAQLNVNIKKADESSTKLASALNRLTFGGVLVASVGILLVLVQFLFENKIWPFSH